MNSNESKCPVCKIELSINSNQIQYCCSCRREFYPISEKDENERLQYDDIESISNDSNSGPVLLTENSKEPKPDSYLRRHFGSHCEITTEVYIPE